MVPISSVVHYFNFGYLSYLFQGWVQSDINIEYRQILDFSETIYSTFL